MIHRFVCALLVSLATLVATASPAPAQTEYPQHIAISVHGDITMDDVIQWTDAIRRSAKPVYLMLNSGGGSVWQWRPSRDDDRRGVLDTTAALIDLIRQRGDIIATVADGDKCVSLCTTIFLAAATRCAGPNADFLFHGAVRRDGVKSALDHWWDNHWQLPLVLGASWDLLVYLQDRLFTTLIGFDGVGLMGDALADRFGAAYRYDQRTHTCAVPPQRSQPPRYGPDIPTDFIRFPRSLKSWDAATIEHIRARLAEIYDAGHRPVLVLGGEGMTTTSAPGPFLTLLADLAALQRDRGVVSAVIETQGLCRGACAYLWLAADHRCVSFAASMDFGALPIKSDAMIALRNLVLHRSPWLYQVLRTHNAFERGHAVNVEPADLLTHLVGARLMLADFASAPPRVECDETSRPPR